MFGGVLSASELVILAMLVCVCVCVCVCACVRACVRMYACVAYSRVMGGEKEAKQLIVTFFGQGITFTHLARNATMSSAHSRSLQSTVGSVLLS